MSRSFVAGSSQYLVANASPIVAYPISFSLWIRVATAPGGEQFFLYYGDSSTGNMWITFNINSSGFIRFWARDTTSAVTSSANIADGYWHHLLGVAYVSGANRTSLYIDGEIIGENVAGASPTQIADYDVFSLGMARDLSPSGPFTGDIAEVALYNSQLNVVDARALYNGHTAEWRKRGSLNNYWDLDGYNLVDKINRLELTNNGSSVERESPDISDRFMFDPDEIFLTEGVPAIEAVFKPQMIFIM